MFCCLVCKYELLNTSCYDIFTAECPDGFTFIESINSCYKVVNYNLNWEHAELVCQSPHSDAHLLIINDAAEQDLSLIHI